MTIDKILVQIIENEDKIIVDIIRQYVTREILQEFYSEIIYSYLSHNRFSFKEYDKIETKYINMGWISPR